MSDDSCEFQPFETQQKPAVNRSLTSFRRTLFYAVAFRSFFPFLLRSTYYRRPPYSFLSEQPSFLSRRNSVMLRHRQGQSPLSVVIQPLSAKPKPSQLPSVEPSLVSAATSPLESSCSAPPVELSSVRQASSPLFSPSAYQSVGFAATAVHRPTSSSRCPYFRFMPISFPPLLLCSCRRIRWCPSGEASRQSGALNPFVLNQIFTLLAVDYHEFQSQQSTAVVRTFSSILF